MKLTKEQHRYIRTFILYLGEEALNWSPYVMEMMLVMALVGEPEKCMTEKEQELYRRYLNKWHISKEEITWGRLIET